MKDFEMNEIHLKESAKETAKESFSILKQVGIGAFYGALLPIGIMIILIIIGKIF